ncbi:MAG: HAMP domain-containing protein, partial [Acidobacteriales bacterium]|nr:HAMP domain-containing protein [Terriglobales bacterium]
MKLFAKIFLTYWAAQALFLVLAMLVTLATRPSNPVLAVQASQNKILSDAIAAYQNGGEEPLRRDLRSVHDAYQAHIFLFDETGRELTGRKPPEWVEKVRRGQERTLDSLWGRLGPAQLLRNAKDGGDGHRYTIIFDFPPDHGFMAAHRIPGLGLMIGIASSGFVCFLLARYLTSPLVRLRAATQQLAAGDLNARAGEPGERRHDEIAELVRDFDSMAERLQKLVNAQNRLLNDISHELRSPLARLNVALGLVRRKTLPEVQGSLDRIE